jgi:hypothetical protein
MHSATNKGHIDACYQRDITRNIVLSTQSNRRYQYYKKHQSKDYLIDGTQYISYSHVIYTQDAVSRIEDKHTTQSEF